MAYAELLAVSNCSLGYGASHPEDLVQTAATQGVSHLGLLDRDAVYGLPRAHKAAKACGVQLVCGATLTVQGRPAVALLVRTAQGWANLCQLLTAARAGGPKGFARVTTQALAQLAPGLTAVLRPGWSAAQASLLREAFGQHLVVALSRQLTGSDRVRVRQAVQLAKALGVPLIASNDVRFHVPEQRAVADVLTCIRRGVTLAEAGRWLAPNSERYLLSQAEYQHRYADFPQAIRQAQHLAQQCVFSLDALHYRYPREVVVQGYTPIAYLRECTQQGLVQRYPGGIPPRVQAQVQHELGLIHKLDVTSYFLTVHDIVQFARSQGILCQGRGSAANSAVCYALHITSVDPNRFSLLFERFISEERGEPPDIDIDFEHERREEVIQYIYARYGRDRSALVSEVITYRHRSAVRDVGKVFGLSLDQVGRLAKAIGVFNRDAHHSPRQIIAQAGLDPADPNLRRTLAMAGALLGFPRHLSIHVGGFTITENPLTQVVPIEPATMPGRTVMQWNKDDLSILGFVKVDVLGLGMLTAIRKTFALIAQAYGRTLTLATVPAKDPAVYDLFCRADTVGVFQIESPAQRAVLPRLRPRCFYDLVIQVALVRPGPIRGGMIHPYLRRRAGQEPVRYAHPALKPILERTLGVPLFQEQVMRMAVAVGGFTPGQADALRRAMGGRHKRGNSELGQQLLRGMRERGISDAYASAILAQIQGFAEYGFPESHAASFALLVYVSGWLKCHYPAAFCAGLINSQPMGCYPPSHLVADAQRHGVVVHPVCVMHSDWDCTLEPHQGPGGSPQMALRLGLRLVKGLGRQPAQALVRARAREPFVGVAQVARLTGLGQGPLRALARANAFAVVGVNPRRALWEIQGLWSNLPLFRSHRRSQ